MAGLTRAGFVPETYEAIKTRIEGKIDTINPGFDFSPGSPDGMLISLFTYELYQAWTQLGFVSNSQNPQIAIGAGLRNIGLLSGLPFGAATRSSATIETVGTAGTVVPQGTTVANDDGDQFYVSDEAVVPGNLQVVAKESGPINTDIGTITTLVTTIPGLDSITQTTAGKVGEPAHTDQQFRNFRTRSVMRNYTSVANTMEARLLDLGLEQAKVVNNTDAAVTLPDGTPPRTIQVIVGEIGDVSRQDIAQVIHATNALGCPTYSATADSEVITDAQGVSHTINFSVATEVAVEITVDVTYLSDDIAGADDNIIDTLFEHVNGLKSGEDVVWSRLFGHITPYAQAQVNTLNIGLKGGSLITSNIVIDDDEYASILKADINFTVT